MVVCAKKQKHSLPNELAVGDCWIAISLADSSGLILVARVGKHTDELIEELMLSTEGKTACNQWNTDEWGGYERVLPPEILHSIGKDLHATIGTQQWDCEAADWEMAPSPAQIWQVMGANKSDGTISGELLQLDLAAQPIGNNGGSTSRTH